MSRKPDRLSRRNRRSLQAYALTHRANAARVASSRYETLKTMASLRNRCPRGLGGLSISIPTADTHDDDYEPEPSSPGTPEAMVSPWQADSAEAMKALHTPSTVSTC